MPLSYELSNTILQMRIRNEPAGICINGGAGLVKGQLTVNNKQ